MSEAPPPREDIHEIFWPSSAKADRLIHLIPDQLAEAVPDHALFSFPKTTNLQDGFVDISCKSFANAINRTSWYLESLLGKPKNFETVAYMGSNDIRYFLFMFGAIKVGYKMLFLSPRNTVEGHLNVLKGVDCQLFLSAKDTIVEHITSEREMRTFIVPELEELMDESPVDVYPYSKTFYEARMDPCLVLHTTGSTGLPKPITWQVGVLSTWESWRTIPPVNGFVPTPELYPQARRAYTAMPFFHTSGLNTAITLALLCGVTLVCGAPHILPNAAYVDDLHKYADVDASMGAPTIFEELSHDPEALERINKLRYIVVSGAPLSQKTGEIISKHTRVIPTIGATETANLQRLIPGKDDWDYFYWHPTHSGIEMREVMDGLYELFLVKDPKLQLYQAIFSVFPEIQEWSMSDLYSRHPDPEKSFLYKYHGRKDDVIVLSNGEKLLPAPIETTLKSDSHVKGAMVVGAGHFQPAVLIDLNEEPPKDDHEKHDIIEALQPIIAEANEHAPAHGKLDADHTLFAIPEKPVEYLGQGKIQRPRTYAKYKDEIDELYRAAEEGENHIGNTNIPKLDVSSEQSVATWLQLLIADLSDNVKELDFDQDMFEAGLDSLQVIKMAQEIKFQAREAGWSKDDAPLLPTTIYRHPTINQLASFIYSHKHGHTNGTTNGTTTNDTATTNGSSDDMLGMLDKYANSLPPWSQLTTPPSTERMTVLLTGSTGSLGSYVLDTLYNDPNVSHIVCLNRRPDAAEKHEQMGQERGLSPLSLDRVQFLKADLSEDGLGLEASTYQNLLETVTHVIHNQWPVNFNWALSSFEPYVRGVRNLIQFSAASVHKSFLLFVSSVAAVGGWDGTGKVPEEAFHDVSVASGIGYGQSKLLSECLLDKAAKISGVRSACCRVGIIAGPVERKLGMWNKHEYIPSIMVSSAYLSAFPASFPSRERIDWIPVDKLSKILLEILVSASTASQEQVAQRGTLMHHVVNPNVTTWSSLAPGILDLYAERTPHVQPVSFDEWLQRLEKSVEGELDVERNPAVKLLDFYQQAARAKQGPRMLSSRRAEEASATLQSVGAVNNDWESIWMRQWGIKA